MSDYRRRVDRRDPPSTGRVDVDGTPIDRHDRRAIERVPLLGAWMRRRRARATRLPGFRRRVGSAYDVDLLARTVVRRGIVDPSEDIVEALAAVHLSQSLDAHPTDGAVTVAESDRFVVYYGVAPDAPPTVSGPYWTLAREASYRQVHAAFGEAFAEQIEADYDHRCRTLLEKGGWLVLAKPAAAWTAGGDSWTLTATRTPHEGYGIRGTTDARDVRRDYTLTDGPLLCRTVRPAAERERVVETDALAPGDGADPDAVWRLVREDFAAWRARERDSERSPGRTHVTDPPTPPWQSIGGASSPNGD